MHSNDLSKGSEMQALTTKKWSALLKIYLNTDGKQKGNSPHRTNHSGK